MNKPESENPAINVFVSYATSYDIAKSAMGRKRNFACEKSASKPYHI